MAWPFSNVAQPNVDSDWVSLTTGYVAVPNLIAGTAWLLGVCFENSTGQLATISIKDANGKVFATFTIADGVPEPLEFPFMPVAGQLQWKSTVAGVLAKLWGYQ